MTVGSEMVFSAQVALCSSYCPMSSPTTSVNFESDGPISDFDCDSFMAILVFLDHLHIHIQVICTCIATIATNNTHCKTSHIGRVVLDATRAKTKDL